jgi:hypothetical protein
VTLGCERATPPEVVVATPIEKSITEFVEFTGRAEAANSVDIRGDRR